MQVQNISEVRELLRMADCHAAEIARQRSRLRAVWRAASEAVDQEQARIRAVDYTLNRRQQAFDDVKRNFGRDPDLDYARDYGKSVLSRPPDQWLQPNANGSWSVMPSLEAIFDRELSAAREKFIEDHHAVEARILLRHVDELTRDIGDLTARETQVLTCRLPETQ